MVPPAATSALVAVETIVSVALAIVAARAYRRSGRGRFGWVAVAFGLFFVRGTILSVGLFTGAAWETLVAVGSAFDVALVTFLYVAVVR